MRLLLLCAAPVVVACSFDGAPITGGSSPDGGVDAAPGDANTTQEVGPFEQATALTGFDAENCQFDDPWLSRDELTIVVSTNCTPELALISGGPDDRDLYIAKRGSRDEPFGTRELLFASIERDQYGRLSDDGQTLFLSIQTFVGERSMFVAGPPDTAGVFSNAVALTVPESVARQEAVAISPSGTEMIFAADDSAGRSFDLIHVTDAGNQTWENRAPIDALNTNGPDFGPYLVSDQLLVFSSNRLVNGVTFSRLFFSRRDASGSEFGAPVMIEALTQEDELDPWLSPDLGRIYFVRRARTGDTRRSIFFAQRSN